MVSSSLIMWGEIVGSTPTSAISLKWAQQSYKTNGRDIKIKDTNKCEAFGAVGEFKGLYVG